jgi:hypothetical protein
MHAAKTTTAMPFSLAKSLTFRNDCVCKIISKVETTLFLVIIRVI